MDEYADWLLGVTHTCEISSSRCQLHDAFHDVLNAFLKLGWKILKIYVVCKEPEAGSEVCVCLLGWTGSTPPQHPEGYKH